MKEGVEWKGLKFFTERGGERKEKRKKYYLTSGKLKSNEVTAVKKFWNFAGERMQQIQTKK